MAQRGGTPEDKASGRRPADSRRVAGLAELLRGYGNFAGRNRVKSITKHTETEAVVTTSKRRFDMVAKKKLPRSFNLGGRVKIKYFPALRAYCRASRSPWAWRRAGLPRPHSTQAEAVF
jgi:hypothetical protein